MKVLLAGSESKESASRMREMGAKHLLLSYYYLRNKKDPVPFLEEMRQNSTFMFLDSGAHTFFHEAGISAVHGEKKTKTAENPEQYLHEYIQWLKEYGSYFDGYAELDIDQIVGHDKILEWHKIWEESGLDKIVYCYHPTQPISYWEKICKENHYVGIQGNLPLQKYVGYLNVAKKYGTKVHGFAMTKTEPMQKLPFFSVGSTSWQSGERFGTTFEFNGRNMIAHLKDDKVAMRRKLKRKAEALGINSEAWIKDSRVEVGQWNVAQWLEMEKFIDKTAKRYWVDDRTGKKTKEEIAQIERDGKYTPPGKKYVDDTNTPEEVEKSLQGQNINNEERLEGEEKEPNVLPVKPNVGKVGNIQEYLKDPTIEQRRREAHDLAMRGNINALKNGSSSKRISSNAFMTCENCYVADRCPKYQEPTPENPRPLCAFSQWFNTKFGAEDFDIRNGESVMNTYNALIASLLERLGRANFFEQMDGGMVDKNLSPLYAQLTELLKLQKKEEPAGNTFVQNNYYGPASKVRNLDETKRNKLRDAIRGAIDAQ